MGRRGFSICLCAAMTFVGSGCQFMNRRDTAQVAPTQPSSHGSRMLQLAQRYEDQGNLEGALRLYRQAAKANPGDPQIRGRIAAITGEAPESPASQTQLAQHDVQPEQSPIERSAPQPEPVSQRPARLTAAQAHEIFSVSEPPAPVETPNPTPAVAPDRSHPAPFPSQFAAASEPQAPAAAEIDMPAWWNSDAHQPDPPSAAPLASNAVWSATSAYRREDAASLHGLMADLDSSDAFDRKAALVRLARHQTDAAAAASSVRELFNDDDLLVQAHAAWTYGEITQNRTPSVAVLTGLLNSGAPDVQQVSAYFLGTYGADAVGAVPALELIRDTTSGATRIHAAEAILRIDEHSTASIDALMLELRLGDSSARALAAITLSGAAAEYQPIVIRGLSDALTDADPQVSSAAALSLGGFGAAARTAIPSLQIAAAHTDQDVSEAAQAALDCIR